MENQDKFNLYKNILRDWSSKMNLVAPSTLNDIDTRHIADSAQLADYLPHDVDIIDLGSGAGFPAVVLAVLGWNVTATESIGKKVSFLNAIKQELDLDNLTVYHGRIEDFIAKLPRNKKYVFTARAFAPLIKILDYVGKTNYELFLLKGRDVLNEISTAKQKYKFDYNLFPSKTGDGFVVHIIKR